MIDDVYNSKLLQFAGNIGSIGSLDAPDASATAHSKLCGSKISVDIKMENDLVTEFSQQVKACALGQAAASIVAANIIGASAEEIRTAHAQMTEMLKEDGGAPNGRFEDLQYLQPVKDYKARHASALLVLEALVEAIGQIERKNQDAA